MRKFKVTLQGQNLLVEKVRIAKHGVFIVRFVEAIDETLAGHTALEDFRCEPKGKELEDSLLNTTDDPAVFKIVEVIEVDSFDAVANLNSGLIFYPENEADFGSSE